MGASGTLILRWQSPAARDIWVIRSLADVDGFRAADQRADENVRLFKRDVTAVDPSLFVPFVVDSSGRLGKSALEFLFRSKMPGRIVHRLKEQISVNVG